MKNPTFYLPGFHLETLRRKPRSAQQLLAEKLAFIKKKTFNQLGEYFTALIPRHLLLPKSSGTLSRIRFFSKETTFWAFFSQILDADGGCQEVVRKLQSYAALRDQTLPSSSTAAYCKARKKLDQAELDDIFKRTSEHMKAAPDSALLNGRRVVVVDGTGLSMPDTAANQDVWPQQKNQKPGCGFPQAAICACFNLRNGALLSYEVGNKKSHELPLLRKQWDTFRPEDIFLGDKGFCSYFDIYSFKQREVDSVLTLARRLPATEITATKVLGDNDLLIQWNKPIRAKTSSYSLEDWQMLPETLQLRQIKVSVDAPGFRVSSFYIITTLLDHEQYPAGELADLYFERWDVELFFRDIKTTMGMDVLRCKSPEMIRKEIVMHFIVYNCIRNLIVESACSKKVKVRRVSFKGSIQALRQWEPHLNQESLTRKEQLKYLQKLYELIGDNLVPERPGRSEPRAVKRRPKPFRLLTAPRREMLEKMLLEKA